MDSSERVVITNPLVVTSEKVFISVSCPASTFSRKADNVVSISFADFSSARTKSAVYVAVAQFSDLRRLFPPYESYDCVNDWTVTVASTTSSLDLSRVSISVAKLAAVSLNNSDSESFKSSSHVTSDNSCDPLIDNSVVGTNRAQSFSFLHVQLSITVSGVITSELSKAKVQ